MKGMAKRLQELERGECTFSGYAVLTICEGQTVESCKAGWTAENGPLGNRQWVIFNFGGLNNAAE
jgi:hypothetical protein